MNQLGKIIAGAMLLLSASYSYAQAGAPTNDELVRPICQGQIKIIEKLADVYFDKQQAVPKEFLVGAFKEEPHRPTRKFMTDTLEFVLDHETRGQEYLHSDRFMKGCTSVMGQKMAGIQAKVRRQMQQNGGKALKPIPQPGGDQENDGISQDWNGSSRR